MNFGDLEEAHGSSYSLSQELDRGTRGDLYLFALTFVMMIAYASVVTCGGDCVESRALLAIGGVVAAVLGISASLGLVSLLGVPFVNIAGCMPFLVLGIGVDDMFLLMAAWSGTLGNRDLSIPERLGSTIRAAGIGITITSLTDGLAFAVGTVSVFESVRNFCFYTGVAVFGCYVCNLTFLAGCMALHGRRVYSGRHTVTCRKVKLRHELKAEGGSSLGVLCCSGNIPEKNGADESLCERAPRLLLPRLVLWTPMKIVIFICFAGFLGVSIWGASGLEQGLRIKNLVLPTSYYYKYNTWEEDIFGTTFPISFVIDQPLDYTDEKASTELKELFDKARDDPDINHLTLFCWLVDYYLSPYFTTTSNKDFVDNLRFKFLPENPQYQNDIVIDEDSDVITASRCHVFTRDAKESTRQAGIMLRMRKLAEESDLNVFAFQPAFVYFEQYAAIVPNTLFTVGVTLAAMCVVSFFLLAHPLMVCLVLFNVVMIVIGIFGFMSLWGLTLSSVTMIHLIMSVGFSVDFSAHVCAAYMTSLECTRHARARQALTHASGPILNGGLSSLVGISVLCVSDSYIFQSFFKIMFLVILFGVLHAVFLMPVILSLVGPELKMPTGSDVREQTITVPSAPPTSASVSNYGTLGENRDVTKVKKRQLRKTAAKYTIREDVLYHDGILVAKRNQVPEILQEFHDNYVSGGHLGMNKTYKKVLERYFWHGMKQEVEDYCRSCCVCQNMNACRKKPAAPLHPIPVPKKKWSLVGMDIIGPLQVTDRGNQYIVALTDHFTKFPVAKAIPCKSSEEVARFMYETICIFGAFDSLITDQGREFINFALDILTDRFNINHRISSAYHPETNGQRERDNRTLKDTLVKITDNDDWDELLPAALFAYRTSVHKSTQFSPFLALYGEQAKLPFDVTGDANEQDLNEEIMDTMKGIHEEVKNKIGENISRAQKKQKEYYDSRRAYDHGFRIGDKVLIINAARVHRMGGKMAPRFVGPYEADNLGG
nr:hypothetical protein BaRGS_031994 [Batillaria attramentaria]